MSRSGSNSCNSSNLLKRLINWFKRYEHTKWYDLAAALPLVLYYGWRTANIAPQLFARIMRIASGSHDQRLILDTLWLSVSTAFMGLLVALLVLRPPPRGKLLGIWPRAAAVAGTFLVLAYRQLPPAQNPPALSWAAMLLILTGFSLCLAVLVYLGRSFSIMPEARGLVTTGPYRIVRHPLYFAEEIAIIGMMLMHAQPWSAALFLTHLPIQFVRMFYEERVLRQSFPQYEAYAARTKRFIPWIY